MKSFAGFKKRWWMLCGLLLVVGLGALLIPRNHEPACDGRPLTFWLSQFTEGRTQSERAQAQHAIRQIGTNAVPALLAMLGHHDSKRRQFLLSVLDRQSIVHFREASDYHLMARNGFLVLGSMAVSAEGELARLREDPDPEISVMATAALSDVQGWNMQMMKVEDVR